jgi:Spy/CpxP family protein refolding chaperone
MRAMRIMATMGLMLMASTAAAQGGGPGGGQGAGQGQRMNEMLFKDITLTPEQKTKIDSIQTKQREDSRALMQPGGGMPDSTTRAKMMELRTKSNAAIRAVLTAEQQVIFDKNLAAMPQGGGRRPPTTRD